MPPGAEKDTAGGAKGWVGGGGGASEATPCAGLWRVREERGNAAAPSGGRGAEGGWRAGHRTHGTPNAARKNRTGVNPPWDANARPKNEEHPSESKAGSH